MPQRWQRVPRAHPGLEPAVSTPRLTRLFCACCPLAIFEKNCSLEPRTGLSALKWAQSWSLGLALPLSPQADLSSLPEIEKALAVFCMATYGEGTPPQRLRTSTTGSRRHVDLSGVKYA